MKREQGGMREQRKRQRIRRRGRQGQSRWERTNKGKRKQQATDTKKIKGRRRKQKGDGGGEWRGAGVRGADAGTSAGELVGSSGIPGDLTDEEPAHERRWGATTGPGWVHGMSQLWSANRELVRRLRGGRDVDDNAVRTNDGGDAILHEVRERRGAVRGLRVLGVVRDEGWTGRGVRGGEEHYKHTSLVYD